jgi:hypothetical protein
MKSSGPFQCTPPAATIRFNSSVQLTTTRRRQPLVPRRIMINREVSHLSADVVANVSYWLIRRETNCRREGLSQAYKRRGSMRAVSRRQSVKISYSDGVVVRFGGKFKTLSVGWQYGWFGLSVSDLA